MPSKSKRISTKIPIKGVKVELEGDNNMEFESKVQLLTEQLSKTLIAKNKDYGDSFGQSYKKYGDVIAAIRLSDKLSRYENLIQSDKQEVNDESIDDTLLDIAGYAILTLVQRMDEDTKQN
jgi:hypothetical protein